MARWSLKDAKEQFSEVVCRALTSGPQMITKNGEDAVVIISRRDFDKTQPKPTSLARVLAESPLARATLKTARPRSSGRSVKF